jgi:pimeloyl-ACP methyl ester carboxylesterase
MTFVAHGGWVGNWELWQEPFQLMQSRWRCIAYDHRGAGSGQDPARFRGLVLVDGVPAANEDRQRPLVEGSRCEIRISSSPSVAPSERGGEMPVSAASGAGVLLG